MILRRVFLIFGCLSVVHTFSVNSTDNAESKSRFLNGTQNSSSVLRYSRIKCGSHEDFLTCGTACEIDCTTIGTTCDNSECKPGCFCRPGYVRENPGGKCISQKRCPRPNCPKHEEYLFCGEAPLCQATCENYGQACDIERSSSCPQGCFCKSGYARHPLNDQCVHVKNCPTIEYITQRNPTTASTTPKVITTTTKTTTSTTTQESPKTCEKYEVFLECGPACQVECSNLGKDCPIASTKCTSGCYCKPGYARDGTSGQCIPQRNCPNPYCPKYEVWLPCGQAPECQEMCSGVDSNCKTRKFKGYCPSGCYCRKGYARHPTTGLCIKKRDCPKEPECGENEDYRECGYRCKEICDGSSACRYEKCESGCFCSEGFVRINGHCVARENCAKKCPPNEQFSLCSKRCNEECNVSEKFCKKEPCVEGCFCISGYKRVGNVCVPISNCPLPKCSKANEVYTTCGKSCNEDCTKSSEDCQEEQCHDGCFCAKGFKRIRRRCVPEEECVCPTNEEYKCGTDCDEDCSSYSIECWKQKCTNKCHCVGNYKRINGVCQPPTNCPCPSNEEYSYKSKCTEECGKSYSDCSNAKQFFDCFCKKNFKRIGGSCISDTNCVCSRNEEYTYGNICLEKCSIAPGECKDVVWKRGCFCQLGYKRINGVCLPDSDCPCGRNEEYTLGNECWESCNKEPEECRSLDVYKRCICKPGYKRIYGNCVPDMRCQCEQNEMYRYGSRCNEVCNNRTIDCAQDECFKGCFCDDGYVRKNGQCVKGSFCGCDENEEYVNSNECSEDCSKTWQDCRSVASSFRCTCIRNFKRINGKCVPDVNCPCSRNEIYAHSTSCEEICGNNPDDCSDTTHINKCFCKSGYKRILGICVKDHLCPCGENEEYRYGNRCHEKCHKKNAICPHDPPIQGCFCKDGFARINGTCQTFDQCACDNNEEYIYSNDCIESCDGNPEKCSKIPLQYSCFCAHGFRRNKKGICVLDTECPCKDPNAEYKIGKKCEDKCIEPESCSQQEYFRACYCKDGFKFIKGTCQPEDHCACEDENEQYIPLNDCLEKCDGNPDTCAGMATESGCYCTSGYRRGDEGNCILESECPCSDQNAEYKQGRSCEEMCIQPEDCSSQMCYKACYCKEGFRNIGGKCQPEDQCSCSGSNEQYRVSNECLDKCKGNPITCQGIPTTSGCFCAPGYRRNIKTETCIPDSECPCLDTNAEYKTGRICEDECIQSDECANEECYKGCFCKDGFKLIDGTCQEESTCSCSGSNEAYQISNICLESCDGNPDKCSGIPTVSGCYCALGYRRDNTGNCIPDSSCPCSDPNSEYRPGKSCEDQCEEPEDCSSVECYKGCFCKEGFRNIDGICQPENQCTCTGTNEQFSVSNECLESCKGNPHTCFGIPTTSGCYCAPGYRRSGKGKCIPDVYCPCYDPNAEYKPGKSCGDECQIPGDCAAKECYKGCFCKDGYKTINGSCQPESSCTCTGKHEEYSVSNDCLEKCNGNPDSCVGISTQSGCYCAVGFRRNIYGKCARDKYCPCQDINTEYKLGKSCEFECIPQEDCSDAISYKACYCKEGYKLIDGTCKPEGKCTCSGSNEQYGVSNECLDKCEGSLYVCQGIPTTSGCYCAPGYRRNVDGECIPDRECPCLDPNSEYRPGKSCEEECSQSSECGNEEDYKSCFCKDGYKLINGMCQEQSLCTCSGTNEAYQTSNNCLESCDGNPAACVGISTEDGCYCAPGYGRDTIGNCVPDTECPCLDPNSEYKPGKKCEDKCTVPDDCDMQECYKGCYCKDGFRNIDGSCQLESKCSCSGTNEQYIVSNNCLETCQGNPETCASIPTNSGCYCASGFRRVDDGTCHPETECTCSDPNSEYKPGKVCEDECEEQEHCSEQECYKGCFCKDGFKNIGGSCQPESGCTCTGTNEQYGTSNDCLETCEGNPETCAGIPTERGCYCAPGFRQDSSGSCIPDTECPCTDPNSEYKPGKSCEDECDESDECAGQECYKGCFCKDGFKNIDGTCLPQNQCTCPSLNELYTYSSTCLDQCAGTPESCQDQRVTLGCHCAPGYRRDASGFCVEDTHCLCDDTNAEYKSGKPCDFECLPGDDCPSQECYKACYCKPGFRLIDETCQPAANCVCGIGPNEVYGYSNECLDKCDGTACEGQLIIAGCYCEPGYKRDPNGICIPEIECPCLDPNSEYKYGKLCEQECNEPIDCSNQDFLKACFCKEGYKNIDGTCAPEANCCLIDNEEYKNSNECFDGCDGTPELCNDQPTKQGCFCKTGYRRDTLGICLPDNTCSCLDPNAEYKTGKPCDYECLPLVDCPYQECYKACFCKAGYKLLEGTCQPETQCVCTLGPNEEYGYSNECLDRCHGTAESCANLIVTAGCYCESGHKRDPNGICISERECPCTDPNAEYKSRRPCEDQCIPTNDCSTDTCFKACYCKDGYKNIDGTCTLEAGCCPNDNEEYKYSNTCIDGCDGTQETCDGQSLTIGCYCATGYRRDASGFCVEDITCPCTDINAEYKSRRPCEDQCTPPVECPSEECYKACFCKDGYKNIDGICTPEAECCQNTNEEYKYLSECMDRCDGTPESCEDQPVILGCHCEPGYRRDSSGTCVEDTTCPCTDPNAEYKSRRPCEDQCFEPVACSSEDCYKACYCKDGYKNIDGICTLEAECCPNENEEYKYSSQCIDGCDGTPESCEDQSVTLGCYCVSGYRRDSSGTCVEDTTCPCSDENAEFKSGKPCDFDCLPSEDCPYQECYKACFCKPGYKLIDGTCQPEADCVCNAGPNEEYGYSNECLDRCDGAGCEDQPITAACYCASGFKRNANDICIPESDCPCSDPNAEYKSRRPCEDICIPPADCSSQDSSKGCYCKDGYKNIGGTCVLETDCCPNDNEEYKTSNQCIDTCNETPESCENEDLSFTLGCYCESGYKRDASGSCVEETTCPCTDANAEYKSRRPCEDLCVSPAECSSEECSKACYCKDGYKNIGGTCIEEADCCPNDNEEYKYSNQCLDECSGTPESCTDQPVTLGCYCEPGYRRDSTGVCVEDIACPCTDPNAEYKSRRPCEDQCISPAECVSEECFKACYCRDGYKNIGGICTPEADCCSNDNEEYKYLSDCMDDCSGTPESCNEQSLTLGCYCESGYRRDATGVCVEDTTCPCLDSNAEFKSGNPCDYDCLPSENCPYQECYKACFCKPGYKLIDGTCQPEADCVCNAGPNEEYGYSNECLDRCDGTACDGEPITAGCYCAPGFKRNANDICIPESDCPCSDPNAEYKSRRPCEDLCIPPADCSTQDPSKGCYCKDGYKNIDGSCAEETNCCPNDNEEYKNSNQCMDTCNETPESCETVDQILTLGCYCESGYKRDASGTCIEEATCPCTDGNAEYKSRRPCEDQCIPSAECTSEECFKACFCKDGYKNIDGTCTLEADCCQNTNEDYKYSNDCMDQCSGTPESCEDQPVTLGCHCEPGYRRDSSGTCVEDTTCPCSDENAEFKPGKPCDFDCLPSEDCPYQECYKACFCKPGYKLIDGTCQPEADCVCSTGQNEEYGYSNECLDRCDGAGCEDQPITAACYCASGFKRNANDICIPESDCPCSDPNAEYKSRRPCEDLCIPPADCSSQDSSKGCYCKDGYKNIGGTCVLETDCCPNDNEEYKSSNQCMDTCNETPESCETGDQSLTLGCYCESGYRRDASGTCIEEITCPCTDPNAEFKSGKTCDFKCVPDADCRIHECFKACYCRDTFKMIDGSCEPENQCTSGGQTNALFAYSNSCMDQCEGNPDACRNVPVVAGFFCNPGFRRSSSGTCIPDSECPCSEPNKEYRMGKACEDLCIPPDNCVLNECYKACYCKEGYRNIDGECKLEAECTCSGPNEEYTYSNECLELCSGTSISCRNRPMKIGCYCMEGYRRIDGECVNDLQCPCTDSNAEYQVGNPCYDECTVPSDCHLRTAYKACFCKDGFKNIGGTCQLQSDCTCPDNREYIYSNNCLEDCDGTPESCKDQAVIPGCYCKAGYRTDETSECIRDTDCPCSDPNAEYKSGKSCDDECFPPEDCPTQDCYKACYCKEGYKKIGDFCELENQCRCSDPNEEYTFSNRCLETCEGTMTTCNEPFEQDCFCKEGFTRFVNGSCLPDEWCFCGGQDEIFKSTKRCQDECSASGTCRAEECFKGCHCRTGFVRVDGDCISENQNSCGANEIFKCGRECEEDCNMGDVDECLERSCRDGCYCREGFLRIFGICVDMEKAEEICPCPPGQKFTCKSDCLESCYDFPEDCDTSKCRYGCHCPNDVLKRQKGQCINVNQCECDDDEQPRNGRLCEEDCRMNSRECRLSTQTTGRKCFCRSGYCRERPGEKCRRT